MSNSITAYGAFGQVSIPKSEIKFGMISNRESKVTSEFGDCDEGYLTPSGAFDSWGELVDQAEKRGHEITGSIRGYLGDFYTV